MNKHRQISSLLLAKSGVISFVFDKVKGHFMPSDMHDCEEIEIQYEK